MSRFVWLALAGCGTSHPEAPAADASPGDAGHPDGGVEDAGRVDAGDQDAGVDEGVFELVGHSDLGARGMSSALALTGDTAFVGSRTDGGGNHENAGVLVVDLSDPAAPEVIGAIGQPDEDLAGLSSRELRAVPERNLLFVLDLVCDAAAHDCSEVPGTTAALKIYDVSEPTAARRVGTFDFSAAGGWSTPHEFFLWRDPAVPDRILVYVTMLYGPPNLVVLDATDPSSPTVLSTWDSFDDGDLNEIRGWDSQLHSLSVSDDGRMGLFAHWGAGFFLVDTSEIADGATDPRIRPWTPVDARIDDPRERPFTHSAVLVPGRDLVVLTDEVAPIPWSIGCPWGWMRLVDVADPLAPLLVGEYRRPENVLRDCEGAGPANVSFTSHNPTPTGNLVLASWYAAGLVAVDVTDPALAETAAVFVPDPLPEVATEDPEFGGAPVEMWSYPIVKDGLVYVVDVRNGLYVLRYRGPHEEEIARIDFREGNSNL